MPRRAREKSSTNVYHVTARGVNKLPIFSNAHEKVRMLEFVKENIEKYTVEIYAFCIMSNHLHFLIKSELEELSGFMAKVLASYAQYYNYKKDRIGYVFQDRYKSECIETEKYFWNCLRYIHLNPVKAKQSKKVEKYKYSSMREYYTGEIEILHKKALEMYKRRFPSLEEFVCFHSEREKMLFEDVEEEQEQQKREIALYLLELKQEISGNSQEDILSVGKYRREFREELEKHLHVTSREASRLIRYLNDLLKDDVT